MKFCHNVKQIKNVISEYWYFYLIFIFFIHYLSLASPLKMLLPGPYRATAYRERELTLDHIHAFLITQRLGRPPWMRDQLNSGATSKTTWA